jgi:hypothetical protein
MKKTLNLIFYGSDEFFAFKCLIFALIPQVVGTFLFINNPSFSAYLSLIIYGSGVLSGILLLKILRVRTANSGLKETIISNQTFLMIVILLSIFLIPDSIQTFILNFNSSNENTRSFLLNNQDVRIINIKFLTLISVILTSLIWLYVTYVQNKNYLIVFLMCSMLFMISTLWSSRTDILIFIIFFLLNTKKIISLRNLTIVIFSYLLMAFYTVFIQNRAEFSQILNTTIFYSAYFGYPLYLFDDIQYVFNDLSFLYSLLGYPVDVLETFFSSSSGITSHLSELATYSYIGFDFYGNEHSQANVLYPHYGILYSTVGYFGIYIYYCFITFLLIFFATQFKRYRFTFRFLLFSLIWDSSRLFSLATINVWIFLFSSLLFCKIFIKK